MGTGRLRAARRIAVTNRTTPSSGRAPASGPAARRRDVDPVGQHVRPRRPTRAPGAAAARPRRTPRSSPSRPRPSGARRPGPTPPARTGRACSATSSPSAGPSGVVRNAASTANGLTTPIITWATSNPASRSRIARGARGLTGRSHGSRSAIRCTGTPSTSSIRPYRSPWVPGRRREDRHLVPPGHQLGRQVVRLHLDAAQPGQVAVRQEGDLHGRRGCHATQCPPHGTHTGGLSRPP